MTKERQNKIIAAIIAFIFMILLWLLLWFIYIGIPQPEEDEGIEVAFGVVEDAGGYMAQQSEAVPIPAEATPPPPATAPSDNDLMTQEDEEALQLARQREEKKRKERELAEAERLQRERERAEAEAKARAEAEARAKAEAERQAKEQAAIAKASQFGSLFGNSGNASGSGDGKGSGQKGNPVGHGSVGAASWSLVGRECKSMAQPSNNFRQEGKVVVSIQVDAAGNVVSASETTGTTVSDYSTIQIALKAARETKFSASSSKVQIGTITYIFKFK